MGPGKSVLDWPAAGKTLVSLRVLQFHPELIDPSLAGSFRVHQFSVSYILSVIVDLHYLTIGGRDVVCYGTEYQRPPERPNPPTLTHQCAYHLQCVRSNLTATQARQ